MADKAPLNKGLLALVLGGGLLLWAARVFGAGPLRTPVGLLLNENNKGDSFTSKVGSIITLTLESNPSAGTWRLSPANAPLLSQPTVSPPMPTSGQQFRQSWSWRLTPEMVGIHRVQLDYQRGDQAPTKSYSFSVNVIP